MKLSELKGVVREILVERSINLISATNKRIMTIYAKPLELYKKVKGDTKSSSYKKSIGLLKNLMMKRKKR